MTLDSVMSLYFHLSHRADRAKELQNGVIRIVDVVHKISPCVMFLFLRRVLKEGRTVKHEAVGTVRIRTESPVGKELEFENRLALASTPPPPRKDAMSAITDCNPKILSWHSGILARCGGAREHEMRKTARGDAHAVTRRY